MSSRPATIDEHKELANRVAKAVGIEPQPSRLKCFLVGQLLVKADGDETGAPSGHEPQKHGFYFADRDLAEAWATFKNLNVSEDVVTDSATIAYLRSPQHRQQALEYFLKVGLFDDDATKRAKDAARPYMITREDVLAGRVKV